MRAVSRARPADSRDDVLVNIISVDSPIGPLIMGATGQALVLLEFAEPERLSVQLTRMANALGGVLAPGRSPVAEQAGYELDEYVAGRRHTFHVPIGLGGTPFQVRVWHALRDIPIGETRSYKAVADAIGRPDAVRAVARANGDNRLAIVVPCHRVIGASGQLVGYGGGLWRKQRLLDLERGSDARLPGFD